MVLWIYVVGLNKAGCFSWQTLTKLRNTRNALTETDKEKFKELLQGDDFYRVRLPSNVLSPPGRNYTVSSTKARCLPRESLDEHVVIHMFDALVNALLLAEGGQEAQMKRIAGLQEVPLLPHLYTPDNRFLTALLSLFMHIVAQQALDLCLTT